MTISGASRPDKACREVEDIDQDVPLRHLAQLVSSLASDSELSTEAQVRENRISSKTCLSPRRMPTHREKFSSSPRRSSATKFSTASGELRSASPLVPGARGFSPETRRGRAKPATSTKLSSLIPSVEDAALHPRTTNTCHTGSTGRQEQSPLRAVVRSPSRNTRSPTRMTRSPGRSPTRRAVTKAYASKICSFIESEGNGAATMPRKQQTRNAASTALRLPVRMRSPVRSPTRRISPQQRRGSRVKLSSPLDYPTAESASAGAGPERENKSTSPTNGIRVRSPSRWSRRSSPVRTYSRTSSPTRQQRLSAGASTYRRPESNIEAVAPHLSLEHTACADATTCSLLPMDPGHQGKDTIESQTELQQQLMRLLHECCETGSVVMSHPGSEANGSRKRSPVPELVEKTL